MNHFELYKTIISVLLTLYIIHTLNTSFFISILIGVCIGILFPAVCSLFEGYIQ